MYHWMASCHCSRRYAALPFSLAISDAPPIATAQREQRWVRVMPNCVEWVGVARARLRVPLDEFATASGRRGKEVRQDYGLSPGAVQGVSFVVGVYACQVLQRTEGYPKIGCRTCGEWQG